jgi:riboflavin-specific deaminase-like protein
VVVQRVLPPPAGPVEVLSLYGNDDRRAPDGRPYVVVNMVTSLDGATAVDGVTAALGSATDRAIFLYLRHLADAVLVGAATVRMEKYGPARSSLEAQAERLARGQTPRPPIVVVSRSVSFDWDTPFFVDADPPPILLLPADTDRRQLRRARQSAEVITAGNGTVDLPGALSELRDLGVKMLLCEGGPTLNTEILRAQLIDEICVTFTPKLAPGGYPRGMFAPAADSLSPSLSIIHVLEEEGFLYVRYRIHG